MSKKIVSLFTLMAFIIFTFSCAVYKTKKEKPPKIIEESKKGKKVQILAVLKTSGERIEFPKKKPAQIINNQVVGSLSMEEKMVEIELDREDIKDLFMDNRDRVVKITTKDGNVYRVIKDTYRVEGNSIIFKSSARQITTSIPLSEVELLWVKRVDPATSFFATIGAIAGVGLGIMLIIAMTKESCPFVYSFDGERYIFDAEPYGGATCEGLIRTEWCELEHLREVDGMYKILITNEVDETQYTDEVKLLVVDHPQGVEVVSDELGRMHTISEPIPPRQCYDNKGRSLAPYIAENDWIFWSTKTDELSTDRAKDLKDELIFEFPKPEGITEAKLLFNGCNTLWASHMVKKFLELYGNTIHDYYESMKNRGPSYQMMMHWNVREELFRLQIRVETEDGCKTKGTIVGGGPFISEDRIYTIDLSDVPGDTLRIKLTPPAAFWMINYLAMDYTENIPLIITEIEAEEAFDFKNRDIRSILALEDGNYLVMPNIGDSAEVNFIAVPQVQGMDRSYFLKASGYYDVHLDEGGACRMDILNRFLTEPGFTTQYAFKEYLKWKKEIGEKALLR